MKSRISQKALKAHLAARKSGDALAVDVMKGIYGPGTEDFIRKNIEHFHSCGDTEAVSVWERWLKIAQCEGL